MSKVQRIVSIIVALYLLLVLIDRFVLVELLVTRIGLSVLLALFEAFAILGAGFVIRGAIARAWRTEDADLPRGPIAIGGSNEQLEAANYYYGFRPKAFYNIEDYLVRQKGGG